MSEVKMLSIYARTETHEQLRELMKLMPNKEGRRRPQSAAMRYAIEQTLAQLKGEQRWSRRRASSQWWSGRTAR